ncbi:hypothetical protein D3C78_1335700 [compost metagenome]
MHQLHRLPEALNALARARSHVSRAGLSPRQGEHASRYSGHFLSRRAAIPPSTVLARHSDRRELQRRWPHRRRLDTRPASPKQDPALAAVQAQREKHASGLDDPYRPSRQTGYVRRSRQYHEAPRCRRGECAVDVRFESQSCAAVRRTIPSAPWLECGPQSVQLAHREGQPKCVLLVARFQQEGRRPVRQVLTR